MTRDTLLADILTEARDPATKLLLLDEVLLDGVSETTIGEAKNSLTFHFLTVYIKTVGETVNLTVTIECSPNGSDWYTVALIDNIGITKLLPLTISTAGNSVYEVVNATTAKYVRAKTAITSGTVTVQMLGRSR